jgi:LL-diaminopimelate aminotransferase
MAVGEPDEMVDARIVDYIIWIIYGCAFKFSKPKADSFLYGPMPFGAKLGGNTVKFACAEQLTEWIIGGLGITCMPWDDTDPSIRLSVSFSSDALDEQRALEILRERVSSIQVCV